MQQTYWMQFVHGCYDGHNDVLPTWRMGYDNSHSVVSTVLWRISQERGERIFFEGNTVLINCICHVHHAFTCAFVLAGIGLIFVQHDPL